MSYRREKQKKNVYQQIKKKTKTTKPFFHYIYAQGKSARARMCVLMRDRVLDVYIYIEEKTNAKATVQKTCV
jgi:hypothetical protein